MTKTTEELIKNGIKLCRCKQCGNSLEVEALCHMVEEDVRQEERERIAKEMERLDSNWSIAGNNFKRIYDFVTAPRSEDNPSKDE